MVNLYIYKTQLDPNKVKKVLQMLILRPRKFSGTHISWRNVPYLCNEIRTMLLISTLFTIEKKKLNGFQDWKV